MADSSDKVLPKLDKIYLNQEIVLCRDTARNAKINVIRELTRKIKKLKEEKHDLPEKIQLKNKAKAAKLIEKIQIIKTISKDDISTVALIYDSAESLKLLQNPEVSEKDKLEVKIARNKVIVNRVEKMLTKYQPVTRKELEAILSSIGAKKNKKKKKKLLQMKELQGVKRSIQLKSKECKQQKPKGTSHEDSGDSSEEFDSEEESNSANCSTKKHKKAKHAVATSDEFDPETEENGPYRSTKKHKKAKHAVATSDEFDSEGESKIPNHLTKKQKKSKVAEATSDEFDAEMQENGANRSTKKHKKAKHAVAMSDEFDAETQENGANCSTKKHKKAKHAVAMSDEFDADMEENGANRSTKKHKKAKHAVAMSDEFDAETQENGANCSTKKHKKAKHAVAMSDEFDADMEENGANRSTKMHKKSKHAVATWDEFDSEGESKIANHSTKKHKKSKLAVATSDDSDAEALDVGRVKKSGKERKKINVEMTDNSDSDAEVEFETAKESAIIHKKPPKIGNKNAKKTDKRKDLDAVSSKRMKTVVPSTKAIRFSDLLLMESESLPSANPEKPKASVVEKYADEFFVSGDGRSTFMARAPSPQSKVQALKENPKYAKLRADYLKEYGAVPNRKELRKLEKQGLIGKKSLVKESVIPSGSSASASGVQPPPRLFLRKLTRDELPSHPSWEAKKKAKEMLVVPFQGTKVKFD